MYLIGTRLYASPRRSVTSPRNRRKLFAAHAEEAPRRRVIDIVRGHA